MWANRVMRPWSSNRAEQRREIGCSWGPGLEPATRAQAPAVGEIQDAIREAAVELRRIQGRLGELCESVPEPGHELEPLAQLWGVLDCVNRNLLAEAIRTLELAAPWGEEWCQQQIAVARRVG